VTLVTIVSGSATAADGPRLPPIADTESTRKFDWVQTASGEWIKGEFDRVYDDKLYFDSDEFGDVTIDWNDVASLIPVDEVTIRLVGLQLIKGTLVMRNGSLRVDTQDGVVEVRRRDVVGIILGIGKESDYWSGKASVGLSARAGNTEQTDLTLRGEIMRQTALTRMKASYTGQISSVSGKSTANSHRVPATFDFFLTQRTFLTVPSFEYFSDEFQNIAARISIGASIGYELVNRSILTWDVGVGASYQNTRFDSVMAGDALSAADVAITANTSVNLDLPRGIEWDNSYKIQIVATDLKKTNHHAESILSFDIWGPLDLDLTFIFDRIESPVANVDDIVPESNDFRITMGLGVDF